MSLTPEEQRKLAIEQLAPLDTNLFVFDETELAAYTAAVELKSFRKIIETESESGWRGVLDMIEARK